MLAGVFFLKPMGKRPRYKEKQRKIPIQKRSTCEPRDSAVRTGVTLGGLQKREEGGVKFLRGGGKLAVLDGGEGVDSF